MNLPKAPTKEQKKAASALKAALKRRGIVCCSYQADKYWVGNLEIVEIDVSRWITITAMALDGGGFLLMGSKEVGGCKKAVGTTKAIADKLGLAVEIETANEIKKHGKRNYLSNRAKRLAKEQSK